MRIMLVTEAWYPQVNGVVTTLARVRDELTSLGHDFRVLEPGPFRTFPCPAYPEIRLALLQGGKASRLIEEFAPDAIHIATEGPLGLSARRWCLRNRFPFSTSYHTRFPEYLKMFFRLPAGPTYAYLRWFHRPSSGVLVPTPSIGDELKRRGFANINTWTRGVDTDLYIPRPDEMPELARPVWMYVGRVSVEKNLDAFLSLDLPGSKVVVGDGPYLERLKRRFPSVVFTGYRRGEALARAYAAASVFVFPSLTDTFGVVMIEAMACGVPVAALPVSGPIDVVLHGETGWLSHDLREACMKALEMSPQRCREHASGYSWEETARRFLGNLAARG